MPTKQTPLEHIAQQIKNNPVMIYMKGTPQLPQCGFSQRAAQVLIESGVSFAYVNVLQDTKILSALLNYANWPTFPQIYVDGELIGGCDVILELQATGELQPLLDAASNRKLSD
ncbi:Grx4 family monothiol glutaredoxin [Rhodoferax sp. 4810]|uniref:Glutaredoxin n=1 Tax=Thiospirillum jenense TaxID=1653858 RepID=A0A839HHS8_9GAMM|nr:Grx4 family monothiol glutaredoxin [Thiospirillum jenense]MBB1074543.1 Grx4 family monothiol glutaredoxin [Rhodoferax jenense]MBB1126517.1 Grx4 family monothiol glutaredoxin [Thiospirillum jenense]